MKGFNLNISAKLLLFSGGFALLVAAGLLFVVSTAADNSDLSQKQRGFVDQQVQALEHQSRVLAEQALLRQRQELANEVLRDFNDVRSWMLDLSVSWLNEAEDNANAAKDLLYSQLKLFSGSDRAFAEKLHDQTESFFDLMLEAVDAYVDENRVKGNSLVAAARVIAGDVVKSIEVYRINLEEKSQLLQAEIGQAAGEVSESGAQVRAFADKVVVSNAGLVRLSWWMLAIVIGLSILFSVQLRRAICNPIEALKSTVEHIEKTSDLTTRVDVKQLDEVGQTGVAFNNMMAQFSEIVCQVIDACSELDKAINQLVGIMEKTKSGVLEQQSSTDMIATAINQMAVTVQEVARNTENASQSAHETKETASQGRVVVQQTMQATDNLSRLIGEANETMARVENDSSKIGSVLDVIRGISEQTNLLALNAAIEAARAGEAGRGFAVVADEVRTLAQRTQQSTAEIQNMITSLQEGTQQAVEIMQRGHTDAQQVASQAGEAGSSLENIDSQVSAINDLNVQIASAAEQQALVTDDINRNVSNISEISRTTTEAVETTGRESEALLRLSSRLAELVKQFKT